MANVPSLIGSPQGLSSKQKTALTIHFCICHQRTACCSHYHLIQLPLTLINQHVNLPRLRRSVRTETS